jgi:hypothetical protein
MLECFLPDLTPGYNAIQAHKRCNRHWPGLTRQSILFERLLRRSMDTRVKPAYDEQRAERGAKPN